MSVISHVRTPTALCKTEHQCGIAIFQTAQNSLGPQPEMKGEGDGCDKHVYFVILARTVTPELELRAYACKCILASYIYICSTPLGVYTFKGMSSKLKPITGGIKLHLFPVLHLTSKLSPVRPEYIPPSSLSMGTCWVMPWRPRPGFTDFTATSAAGARALMTCLGASSTHMPCGSQNNTNVILGMIHGILCGGAASTGTQQVISHLLRTVLLSSATALTSPRCAWLDLQVCNQACASSRVSITKNS